MATTRSKTLGCGSVSSCTRTLRLSDRTAVLRRGANHRVTEAQRKTGAGSVSGGTPEEPSLTLPAPVLPLFCLLCASVPLWLGSSYFGENGCLTESFFAVISSIFGSP